jgi:predicted amidohydrolase
VRQAASLGAELVALPETWTVMGGADVVRAGAQDLAGEALSWARAAAAELGIDLLAGSVYERGQDSEKGFNTSVHIGPDGELRAVYRKIHLFDVTVDGTDYGEAATQQAGDEIVVSRLASGLGLGLTICYDLRFPELYRALMVAGAQVITVPAQFQYKTGMDHWEILVRARAVENQCFVVAADQWGSYGDPEKGRRSYGNSMIVDPWGRVLSRAGDEGDDILTADLDLSELRRVREMLPALQHRRLGITC